MADQALHASAPELPPDGRGAATEWRLGREIWAGGVSTAAVSALLNPVDVIKTRRQLSGSPAASAIGWELWGAGGVTGVIRLWRPGLDATIARELVYSGCTKGLYPLARDAFSGNAEPTLAQRALAASATGFGGSIGANALDLAKIRAFAYPERYPSVWAALAHIGRTEGVAALITRGTSASAPRGAVIAVGEVTTYDHTKSILRQHMRDGFSLHVLTSLVTGLVAATVAAPFDLLKSRLMASETAGESLRTVLFTLLRTEGPAALWNGWWPTYLRLGPHAILTFPLYEAMRRAAGLEYL